MTKVRTFLILGILLALPSGYGMFYLVTQTLPYLRERWLFFFSFILFVSGVTLPVFAALNKYFFSIRRIVPSTIVRESLVCGILCGTMLWFQIGRVLNPTIIFLCVGGFFVIEILLRTRDSVNIRGGFDNMPPEK